MTDDLLLIDGGNLLELVSSPYTDVVASGVFLWPASYVLHRIELPLSCFALRFLHDSPPQHSKQPEPFLLPLNPRSHSSRMTSRKSWSYITSRV